MKERMRATFDFPKTFFVVNGIELLERGAYYSFAAVSVLFIRATFIANGMAAGDATSLSATFGALLFLLLYAVPVVASPFTEKYGYRASLILVFALLVAGYTTAFFATSNAMVVAYIFLIGIGAGIFKPIPAAIVTQTSTDERRSLAFSIYYACINIGALVFPALIGLAGTLLGYVQADVRLYRLTFAVCASIVGVNVLISLFMYRNLREPQKDMKFGDSMRTLGEIRKYPSFLVLMLIYAGFWFMYGLILSFLPSYMVDYHRMPSWFNELYLQTLNPLVIVIGAPLIAPLATRFKPLALITTGVLVYSIGLIFIGFSTTSLFFMTGIVVYSIGELLTYPAWLAYVSRVAPGDKVSTFLGYGFIPIGVGQFLGAKVGGDLYAKFGVEQGRPELYWAIIASIGFASAGAFLIYNFIVTRRTTPEAEPDAKPRRRFPIAPLAALVILLTIPALVFAGSVMPVQKVGAGGSGGEGLTTASVKTASLPDIKSDGVTKAGTAVTKNVTIPSNAAGNVTFLLTWTDEPDAQASTNTPDTFELHIYAPNGTMLNMATGANAQGKEGKLTITLPTAGPGEYAAKIVMKTAGPQQSTGPTGPLPTNVPGPLAPPADEGNAWTLKVSYGVTA